MRRLLHKHPKAGPANGCPIPTAYRSAFARAANDSDLPLAMLVAVAQTESRMTPTARSAADARGLLQVLPSTAAALELDVDRPATNVLAGARYLRRPLPAYNAGPTAVAEAGGAPTQETLEYVADVTSLWRTLRDCR